MAFAWEQFPTFHDSFSSPLPVLVFDSFSFLWDTDVSLKMCCRGIELSTPHVLFLSQFLKENINPREMLKEYCIEHLHTVRVHLHVVNMLPHLLYFSPYMCMNFYLKLWY